MATYRRLASGKWYAEVFRKGVRASRTFVRKASAERWALETEIAIDDGKYVKREHGGKGVAEPAGNPGDPDRTFADLLDRYKEKVTPSKRGSRWERVRIDRIKRDPIARARLADLDETHFAEWRDRRLEEVSAGTVLREWNLLSNACRIAEKEWKWLSRNPMRNVQRPAKPAPRDRRISDEEIERIASLSGYAQEGQLKTSTARAGAAFLFAIETAMRAGEICGLSRIHVHDSHVHLPHTKTGIPRDVPLTPAARRILDRLLPLEMDPVFGLTPARLDALFRKIKKKAGITDLHFHDTRREALTRLSKLVGPMELARISGHRDLKILMSVYYAPKVEDLSRLLNDRLAEAKRKEQA